MIEPQDIELLSLPYLQYHLACSFKGARGLPKISAIYFCLKNNGLPIYIGETDNLMHRWANSHDKKIFCRELKATRLSWLQIFHDDGLDYRTRKNERMLIEKAFIHYYLPDLNDQLWAGCKHRLEKRKEEVAKLRLQRFGHLFK